MINPFHHVAVLRIFGIELDLQAQVVHRIGVAQRIFVADQVGLEGVENINYLQAIKRVIGMIDKPLAN